MTAPVIYLLAMLKKHFQQINSSFSYIWDGGKSSITLSDINNDNIVNIFDLVSVVETILEN